MGTSSSSKGPRPGSPLIPPWANPLPDPELPPVPPNEQPPNVTPEGNALAAGRRPGDGPATLNLTGFRRTLGNAVSGKGSSGGLQRALGSYAKATGGGKVAAQKLGSPIRTGGRVISLFGGGTATGPTGRTLTLASLNGLSVRVAVDRIVEALVPGTVTETKSPLPFRTRCQLPSVERRHSTKMHSLRMC